MRDNGKTEEILKYLSTKYNKEFSEDSFIKGSDTFPELYGADKIIAHPVDNPEEVFIAYESSKDKNTFYDNYPLAKWAEELRNKNSKAVSSMFSEEILFKIILNASYDKYDANMVNMDALEYLITNNDVNLTFKIAVKASGSPDIEKYQEQLFQLFNMVKAVNTTEYAISVGFVDDKEDFTAYIKTAGVNNIAWSNLKTKVYGYITVDETKTVKSAADLIKFYKQVEE
jgi:hypothetical protein